MPPSSADIYTVSRLTAEVRAVLETGFPEWKKCPTGRDPVQDERTPVWEVLHHGIRRLNEDGETAAGEPLARTAEKGEPLRQLAYHLYTLCERAG